MGFLQTAAYLLCVEVDREAAKAGYIDRAIGGKVQQVHRHVRVGGTPHNRCVVGAMID